MTAREVNRTLLDTNSDKLRPNSIDYHIAQRMRRRRTTIFMTLVDLAEILGVSFQQVRKYERGIDRISAARLFDISQALGVSIDYFFQQQDSVIHSSDCGEISLPTNLNQMKSADPKTPHFVDDIMTLRLIRNYYRIKNPTTRRQVLALIRAMAPKVVITRL